MRIFLFLLSLIIVVCSAVLAYLGFNETLPFVYYMLSSTALSAKTAEQTFWRCSWVILCTAHTPTANAHEKRSV